MKRSLNYIIFEVTSLCNLDCIYCYNIWKRPNSEITHFNSFKNALKTLKKLYKTAKISNITFTGGEPLLAERLSELILYCRLKNSSVTVISNGCAGSNNTYKELIQLAVNLFEFPIHSHKPEIHNYLTRRIGSHEKTVQSVLNVLELGGNAVVDIVVNKLNAGLISETLKFIKSIGVNRVMLTRFNIGGEGIKNIDELILDNKSLNVAFHLADEACDKYNLKITSNVCTPLCILNPSDFKNIHTLSCSANIRNMPVTLDINGNMRICNHSPVIIGNIFKQSFEEIENSVYVKRWKEVKPDFCSNCNVYDQCFGGCRAASEQLGLSLTCPDPIIEYSELLMDKY